MLGLGLGKQKKYNCIFYDLGLGLGLHIFFLYIYRDLLPKKISAASPQNKKMTRNKIFQSLRERGGVSLFFL